MQMIFTDVRCPQNSMYDDLHSKIEVHKSDTERLMPNVSDEKICCALHLQNIGLMSYSKAENKE